MASSTQGVVLQHMPRFATAETHQQLQAGEVVMEGEVQGTLHDVMAAQGMHTYAPPLLEGRSMAKKKRRKQRR
jgi:hypothetical protein